MENVTAKVSRTSAHSSGSSPDMSKSTMLGILLTSQNVSVSTTECKASCLCYPITLSCARAHLVLGIRIFVPYTLLKDLLTNRP